MSEQRRIVFDLDGTLCELKKPGESYADVAPKPEMIAKMNKLREDGWYVIISTARGMTTLKSYMLDPDSEHWRDLEHVTEFWLWKNDAHFDELHFRKKAAATYYVDDLALRPDEFLAKTDL